MTCFEKFVISILDTISHKNFFNSHQLEEQTGYTVFEFEQTINNIKTGKINITNLTKDNIPELEKMLKKSLALLTQYPHNNRENNLKKYTGFSLDELKEILNKIMGKNVTIKDYYDILNQ